MSRTFCDHDPKTTPAILLDEQAQEPCDEYEAWLDATRPPMSAEECDAEWDATIKELDHEH